MDDTISSGDSDVEIIGVYDRHLSKADPPPLSDVKVYVADDAVNVNVGHNFLFRCCCCCSYETMAGC